MYMYMYMVCFVCGDVIHLIFIFNSLDSKLNQILLGLISCTPTHTSLHSHTHTHACTHVRMRSRTHTHTHTNTRHTALDLAMISGHSNCTGYLTSCHAPSGGGLYHRAALTIQAVWKLHRHKVHVCTCVYRCSM